MPTSVIEHIRRVVGDGLRDGELLGRYVDRRDEAALAALVNRHGPMVWGVCRRHLSHHDAEDAFQATFIVLVRKAASVAQREAVGNWLYGVALQTALQARRSAARRRVREVQVTEMPDAEAPQERWADLQPLLDEELSRLPDHYRTVIVLSDLEGRTRKEVAAQLGCPEGTVASRLVRARSMLAKRLTQRGVALSGGALAVVLSQGAGSAGVPAAVVSSTIKAASLCAAGQAAIPVKVAALAEGVLKAMLLNKLKPALAVLVVLAMVGLIGYGMARGQQKGDAVQKPASEPKAPKDAVVKEKAEKEDATAWGKEVDGLQAGLAADSSTCRQGEMLKFTLKLRNVGKAEATVTYSLSGYTPSVTTDIGGRVHVYMPPPYSGYSPPIKRTLKPGETITLHNPKVAVEPEGRARLLVVKTYETSTICVAPGKYKLAFDGMIQSHPKLATGTVECEVKQPAKPAAPIKDDVAWGKEVDGLQAGLAADSSTCRQGEILKLTFKLRNVGKAEVTVDCGIPQEWAPQVTTGTGGRVTVYVPPPFGGFAIPIKRALKPGETLTLDNAVFVDSGERAKAMRETLVNTTTICVAPGKYKIAFDGMIQSHPKLATGTVEVEVKEPAKPAAPIKDDVAWGKEADGLQAGIVGPSTVRIGEKATFTVKLRNVGKAEVSVTYLNPRYCAPEVTTDTGGRVRVYITRYWELYSPQLPPIKRTLKPGETITLYNPELAVESEDRAKLLEEMLVIGAPTICVAPGKYKIEYGGMIQSHPKVVHGTLELEIKSAEKK